MFEDLKEMMKHEDLTAMNRRERIEKWAFAGIGSTRCEKRTKVSAADKHR